MNGPQQLVGDPASPDAGSELRARFEGLGSSLAERMGAVVSELQRRSGPKAVADSLGITTVTASRLLKALDQDDPIATLQLIPGPKPLGQIVESARRVGVGVATCDAAQEVVAAFDELIRVEAGNRSALNAMISTFLPQDQREFAAQRRQSVFKAMAELNGVSGELVLNQIVLHPGQRPSTLDIIDVKAMLGIDRIRPDAVVQFGTQRLGEGPSEPRLPTNLRGEPALDGLHTVRLDAFCTAKPAPLAAKRFDGFVQYSLAPTGFGRTSKVDLVLAEVNRGELEGREPNPERPPYFFTIPDMPIRRLVFDLVVHEDVFPGCDPELVAYDIAGRGPARAGDPSRELDRRPVPERMEILGSGMPRRPMLEFPRYRELQQHVFDQLGWDARAFRTYRIAIHYPLLGTQITFSFSGSSTKS